MAQFKSVLDFVGSYNGNYDGRNAHVTIEEGVAGEVSFNILYTITFTDLDRNETYKGVTSSPEGVLDLHVFSNITLQQVNGNGSVYWSKLYLHTWDIAYMSGVSVWNGIEYGMSFKRV